jgi:hypothetical protein
MLGTSSPAAVAAPQLPRSRSANLTCQLGLRCCSTTHSHCTYTLTIYGACVRGGGSRSWRVLLKSGINTWCEDAQEPLGSAPLTILLPCTSPASLTAVHTLLSIPFPWSGPPPSHAHEPQHSRTLHPCCTYFNRVTPTQAVSCCPGRPAAYRASDSVYQRVPAEQVQAGMLQSL